MTITLRTSALCAASLLVLLNAHAYANGHNNNCCVTATPVALTMPGGLYFSVFGGSGKAVDTHVFQYGTVIDGPLDVNASGSLDSHSLGFGGMNFGYALKTPCSFVSPALEFEGYYLSNRLRGNLYNPSFALPDHFFNNSFRTHSEVFLINSVFTFNNQFVWGLQPYFGVGFGSALQSIRGTSIQTNPPEALNHFNSRNHSSDSTFAGQVKVGLSYMFAPNWSVFVDYRFLYLGAHHYNFGSTVDPTHATTTSWGVNTKSQRYNLGSIGIKVSA